LLYIEIKLARSKRGGSEIDRVRPTAFVRRRGWSGKYQ